VKEEAREEVKPEVSSAAKPSFKRRPLGNRRSLVFDGMDEKNFVYRVVNDRPGRLEMFKEAGWEPVRNGRMGDENTPGTVVQKQVGNGVIGVLMRKPRDWEEHDLAPRVEKANKEESAIFGEVEREDRYGKITINERTAERR
jgi:hypothetical protein